VPGLTHHFSRGALRCQCRVSQRRAMRTAEHLPQAYFPRRQRRKRIVAAGKPVAAVRQQRRWIRLCGGSNCQTSNVAGTVTILNVLNTENALFTRSTNLVASMTCNLQSLWFHLIYRARCGCQQGDVEEGIPRRSKNCALAVGLAPPGWSSRAYADYKPAAARHAHLRRPLIAVDNRRRQSPYVRSSARRVRCGFLHRDGAARGDGDCRKSVSPEVQSPKGRLALRKSIPFDHASLRAGGAPMQRMPPC